MLEKERFYSVLFGDQFRCYLMQKKIIEKCMQMQFLIDHDILYQKQCGFQKKSNVQAVINIIEDIEKST